MLTLTLDDFVQTRARIAPHIKHTPLLTSQQLSERHRLRRSAQGRAVSARRVVQDPRAAQQVRADVGRGETPRRRVLVGGQSRAGRGARGADSRDSRRRVHGDQRDAGQGRGDEGVRRRGRAARQHLGRGEREGEGARAHGGTHLRPSRSTTSSSSRGRARSASRSCRIGRTSTRWSCRSAAAD